MDFSQEDREMVSDSTIGIDCFSSEISLHGTVWLNVILDWGSNGNFTTVVVTVYFE